jgi:PAS domain S-box-containing protein
MYKANSKNELIEFTNQGWSKGEQEHNIDDFIAIASGFTSNSWEGADETLTGEIIEIRLNWSVVPGHEDEYSRVIVMTEDITDRKQAERDLRDSEERFRQLFDRMLDGVYRSTHIGKFVDVNPAMVNMFGYSSKEEMLEVDIKKELYFAPDERGSHLLDTGQEEVDVYRMRRKDGSEIWVEDHGSYVHDEQGNIIFHEGILRDITERKLAEQELRDSDERFRQLAENIEEVFWISDPISGRDIYISPAYEKIWGRTVDDMLHSTNVFIENILQEDRPNVLQGIEKQRSGKKTEIEYRITRPDGSVRWVWDRAFPIHDDAGRVVRVLGIAADITERKRIESETERHLAELKAIYENGLAVGQLLEVREIGERIIDTFTNYLSWHHVTIRLKQNEGDGLELVAFSQPYMEEHDRSNVEDNFTRQINKVGQGLSGWAVQTGNAIRTGNVHQFPQYVDVHKGIQSGLYMPLMIGKFVIGVISVESEEPDAFSEEDERLLATFATQAAVAFENARLYQSVRQELNERKRVEVALRSSETYYRDLADSITDVFFELNHDLSFTHWNKASEALTGIPAADAISNTMLEIFGESDEQLRIKKIYESVLLSHQPRTFQTRFTRNNEVRSFDVNAYPSTRGVSVMAKDVTESKRSEIILQKRFELMEYSAHHSLNELMQKTTDEVSKLTDSEIAFFHFIEEDGISLGMQTWSTNTLMLFHVPVSLGAHLPLDQAGVWAEAARKRRSIIQNDYEVLSQRKELPEGHVRIVREMVIPIIRNERILAILGVANKTQEYTQQDLETAERLTDYAWDITERKQMETALLEERTQLAKRVEERTSELIKANSNLARAIRVKDEFLANMSHELRTPLNAILGLSESLAEQIAGPLNDKQLKYITTISESGHHLLSLINDILDLAKIEAGQITLDINKVDVNSVCQASLRMIKQLAQKKEQEVIVTIDDNVGLMWVDERRLKQMVVNLLSNAVKFTPEKGKLGLAVHGNQDKNRIEFSVWDNGIGVSTNDLPRLFQPFVQLNSGLARESTGTGLGLVLVSQMARLHGGSIKVASEPGKGSRFTIMLPWESAPERSTVEKLKNTGKLELSKPDPSNQKNILLIEDTMEVIMMIKDYLESAGYRVTTAQDGIEGINQALLIHPDLILMDIQMPRMDGIEATKKLRADPSFKYVPIIALTALAMPNDRELCIAAGMDEYMSKPVNLKDLTKIIQKCISKREVKTRPL